MTQSETGIKAVPSAADTWTSINVFTVPAGVQRISKVRFAVATDWGTTAGSVRNAPVFRLLGSGLKEQSPHEFLGMFGASSTVTTGGCGVMGSWIEYDVDIPVQTGGTVDAQINSLDEAVTAGTSSANLFYDNESPKASNAQSQYVDAAGTTTADAWTSVGTFTLPRQSEASNPKFIRMVVLGVAEDNGTSAVSLRTASRFRLTGSGIAEGGSHEFIGSQGIMAHIGTSASQGAYHSRGTVQIPVRIPVNAGGTILAEHIFDVETPTASTVSVGLLYE